jgi:hypothetical protein
MIEINLNEYHHHLNVNILYLHHQIIVEMYHEMDIMRRVLMNQHLNFEINEYYHVVELMDCKFLMPIKKQIRKVKEKNKSLIIFYYYMFSCICW